MKFKHYFLSMLAVALATFAQAAEPPKYSIPPGEVNPSKVFQSIAADEGPDWGVLILQAPDAWKKTKGKGVKVAVLDTGATLSHPDLKAAYAGSKDFTGSSTGVKDAQGHGTHCAGSIGARGPLPGVAPECSIYAGKVLGDDGSGSVDQIAAGIRYAAKVWEVDVISMSLGGSSADTWMPPALAEADAAGVIIVAAAGNEGPAEGTEGYPGHYPQCVSVAACDANRQIAQFSSRGSNVWITGPGVNIRSTYKDGQYATMSGTSMATPHIAGLAALWVAAHPEVAKKDRPKKFREALKASTKFADRNSSRGYGLPEGLKLVADASQPPQPPAGVTVTITLDSLTPEARAALVAAGVSELTLKLSTQGKATPTADPVPVQSVVPGVWTTPGVQPWFPPLPESVPQTMPNRCPGGVCPAPQAEVWQPFGGRFRPFR